MYQKNPFNFFSQKLTKLLRLSWKTAREVKRVFWELKTTQRQKIDLLKFLFSFLHLLISPTADSDKETHLLLGIRCVGT